MKKKSDELRYLQIIRGEKTLKAAKRIKKRHRRDAPPHKPKSLDSLIKMSLSSNLNSSKESYFSFIVPQNFSIIENPEETLKFISRLASLSNNQYLRKLHLDHSKIKKHDLGAEILLGYVAQKMKETARFRNRIVSVSGDLPASEFKKRLIRALGVVKKLDIQDQMISPDEDDIEIFDFEGIKSNTVRPGAEDRKNRCARLFVEHLNKCLDFSGRQLTDDAIQRLIDFIGEIIGNSEDHSGSSRWFVSGYLDEKQVDANTPENEHFCEIVIYNFGKSIAKTFLELPNDSYSMIQIHPYLDAHKKQGFFSYDWNIEDLITLISLQSYVSSKHIDEFSDRGQGTVDLIEFFHKVAKECAQGGRNNAKMSITSGNTHIIFDDKYHIQKNTNGREVIAFNKDNDLNQKPDKDYIKHFNDVEFPGTIICIKFPLSNKLTEVLEETTS